MHDSIASRTGERDEIEVAELDEAVVAERVLPPPHRVNRAVEDLGHDVVRARGGKAAVADTMQIRRLRRAVVSGAASDYGEGGSGVELGLVDGEHAAFEASGQEVVRSHEDCLHTHSGVRIVEEGIPEVRHEAIAIPGP